MLGTTVYYRDQVKGWVVGRVDEVIEGGRQVMCCEPDGVAVKVRGEDVAVARTESLGEVPNELSCLSALHPATFVLALKKRYESGVVGTMVGRNVLLYLTPTHNSTLESIVASDSKKADYYNPSTLYPPNYTEPDNQPLQDQVNEGLFEPIGWWTHAKSTYETCMTTGRGTLVCLGEGEGLAWLHRLSAYKIRRQEDTAAVAAIRLGSTTANLPPHEDEFHDDLNYNTGFPALQSPSQRAELCLARQGNGRWLERDKVPATREHLRLTTLLADAHALLETFLGAGGGRRGTSRTDAELEAPYTHPPAPLYCRHVKMSYDSAGVLQGFFLKAYWTSRSETKGPPHAFRLLANSKGRTMYLGPHDHPTWYSPVQFVASGEAFKELQTLFTKLSFKPQDLEAMWGVVGAVMLMKLIKFEEVAGKAEMFTECLDQVAQLIAVSPQVLRYTLCPPRKLSRKAAEMKRDALCDALYEGVVQWIIANMNMRSNAAHVVDAPYIASVINIPGIAKPPPGSLGTLGDLCHNINVDALWGLYDTTVFDTTMQTATAEKCPLDPLLDQLRGRPVLERLNPLLQTLSHLDMNGPSGVSEEKECSHASGESIKYELIAVPAPPLNELYKNGVLGTATGDFVEMLLKRCKKGSMAAEAISVMSELLTVSKAETLSANWLLSINPADTQPSITTNLHSRPLTPFSGILVENGLYSCRIVETALLGKVGYPVYLPLQYFASLCKPIIYPSQLKAIGIMRSVKLIAETVFSSKGMAWEKMMELPPLPVTPAPMHIGHTKVLLTTAAMGRIESIRRFTMNKLAVLIQTFARATLPVRIWKINHNARTIQKFGRIRISRGFAAELLAVRSMKVIAAEMVSLESRRRTWRSIHGVATSRLTYAALKNLLASQARDQELFVEKALKAQYEYGLQESEKLQHQLLKERAQLHQAMQKTECQSVVSDESTLRQFLVSNEITARQVIRQALIPLSFQASECTARLAILRQNGVECCNLLYGDYEYHRERLELTEIVEWMALMQAGNFMLQFEEEKANRLIITHSESRCRDLMMKDHTLGVLKLDGAGFSDPSYGSDWKVELEGLRREVIQSAEQSERAGLYKGLLEAMELTCRASYESQCQRWFAAVLGRGNPIVVQYECDRIQTKIWKEEAVARSELVVYRMKSAEKAQRKQLLKTCEQGYHFLGVWHVMICKEMKQRQKLVNDHSIWYFTLRSSTPSLTTSPAEKMLRKKIEMCEYFCRCHIKDRLVKEFREMEDMHRLMGYWQSNMKAMSKIRSDYVLLQTERKQVREQLAQRKPIIRKAYDPELLIVRKTPLPPVPPVATELYEKSNEIHVRKQPAELCKWCKAELSGRYCMSCGRDSSASVSARALPDHVSVSPPRSVSKQTALVEAQALLKSMMETAKGKVGGTLSPEPPTGRVTVSTGTMARPSPTYDTRKIPDPFSSTPPPSSGRRKPSVASAPDSSLPPSLVNAASNFNTSLLHLQHMTGKPPAPRPTPPPPPPKQAKQVVNDPPSTVTAPLKTFSFVDIYNA